VRRIIFGSKRYEVTGGWRKLHTGDVHNLYFSTNSVRMVRSGTVLWAGHVARMGVIINAYKIVFDRPEEKRPLGISGRRWEDNIKMGY
jgi:hypothetical protein